MSPTALGNTLQLGMLCTAFMLSALCVPCASCTRECACVIQSESDRSAVCRLTRSESLLIWAASALFSTTPVLNMWSFSAGIAWHRAITWSASQPRPVHVETWLLCQQANWPAGSVVSECMSFTSLCDSLMFSTATLCCAEPSCHALFSIIICRTSQHGCCAHDGVCNVPHAACVLVLERLCVCISRPTPCLLPPSEGLFHSSVPSCLHAAASQHRHCQSPAWRLRLHFIFMQSVKSLSQEPGAVLHVSDRPSDGLVQR